MLYNYTIIYPISFGGLYRLKEVKLVRKKSNYQSTSKSQGRFLRICAPSFMENDLIITPAEFICFLFLRLVTSEGIAKGQFSLQAAQNRSSSGMVFAHCRGKIDLNKIANKRISCRCRKSSNKSKSQSNTPLPGLNWIQRISISYGHLLNC